MFSFMCTSARTSNTLLAAVHVTATAVAIKVCEIYIYLLLCFKVFFGIYYKSKLMNCYRKNINKCVPQFI